MAPFWGSWLRGRRGASRDRRFPGVVARDAAPAARAPAAAGPKRRRRGSGGRCVGAADEWTRRDSEASGECTRRGAGGGRAGSAEAPQGPPGPSATRKALVAPPPRPHRGRAAGLGRDRARRRRPATPRPPPKHTRARQEPRDPLRAARARPLLRGERVVGAEMRAAARRPPRASGSRAPLGRRSGRRRGRSGRGEDCLPR